MRRNKRIGNNSGHSAYSSTSTLTSHIPARLLPGSGTSDYLWRRINDGETMSVHLENKLHNRGGSEDGFNVNRNIEINVA